MGMMKWQNRTGWRTFNMPRRSDFHCAARGSLRGKRSEVVVICVAVLIALFLVRE
jgi:hypothetical protein